MKKMLMLLSLIVIALFVVSCAPKEGDDGAIAGQAIKSCKDTDGGAKLDQKGTVTTPTTSQTDKCVGNKLTEYYCSGQTLKTTSTDCSKITTGSLAGSTCIDGACVKKIVPSCVDGDLGMDLTKKGTVINELGDSITDSCINDVTVKEGFCTDNQLAFANKNCGNLGEGYKCNDGICVKTCTLGPTGISKCAAEGTTMYYVKEYHNATCGTYLSKDWKDKTWCGYNSDATKLAGMCMEGKGCCSDQLVSTSCEGSVMINTSKNSCTNLEKVEKNDCSYKTSWYTGQPLGCATKTYSWSVTPITGCYDVCTPGESITTCSTWDNQYSYTKSACYSDGIGWNSTSSVSSCPTGQTCKLFDGKTNGLCS